MTVKEFLFYTKDTEVTIQRKSGKVLTYTPEMIKNKLVPKKTLVQKVIEIRGIPLSDDGRIVNRVRITTGEIEGDINADNFNIDN